MTDLPTFDELLAEEVAKNPEMYERHPNWIADARFGARRRWIGECEWCRDPIFASERGPLPRFCSANCRVARHREQARVAGRRNG